MHNDCRIPHESRHDPHAKLMQFYIQINPKQAGTGKLYRKEEVAQDYKENNLAKELVNQSDIY